MIGCETARRLIDERLDGEIGPTEAIDLEVHLRGCASCREIAAGLEGVAAGLLLLPLETMPDGDLETVLGRTIGAQDRADKGIGAHGAVGVGAGVDIGAGVGARAGIGVDVGAVERASTRARAADREVVARHWARPAPYVLAAAAVLAAVAIVPMALRPTAPPEPTVAQIETAAHEARMVLALASRAMRSAELTARDRVIAREVSPALKRVPVRWKKVPSPRRNGA